MGLSFFHFHPFTNRMRFVYSENCHLQLRDTEFFPVFFCEIFSLFFCEFFLYFYRFFYTPLQGVFNPLQEQVFVSHNISIITMYLHNVFSGFVSIFCIYFLYLLFVPIWKDYLPAKNPTNKIKQKTQTKQNLSTQTTPQNFDKAFSKQHLLLSKMCVNTHFVLLITSSKRLFRACCCCAVLNTHFRTD